MPMDYKVEPPQKIRWPANVGQPKGFLYLIKRDHKSPWSMKISSFVRYIGNYILQGLVPIVGDFSKHHLYVLEMISPKVG